MTQKQAAQLSALNRISILAYMDAQGVNPLHRRNRDTVYRLKIAGRVCFPVVHHVENRFIDEDNQREGGVVDLVSLLYLARYSDIANDPIMYGFDKVAAKA